MSIVNEFRTTATGTYDQSETSWTQPAPFRRVKGVDLVSWKLDAVSTGWNSSTVTAQLQGSLDADADSSSDWEVISSVPFSADGNQMGTLHGYNRIPTGQFRSLRVFHILSGSPTADITINSTIQADYVS